MCTALWRTLLPYFFLKNRICYAVNLHLLSLSVYTWNFIADSARTEGKESAFERRVLDENVCT